MQNLDQYQPAAFSAPARLRGSDFSNTLQKKRLTFQTTPTAQWDVSFSPAKGAGCGLSQGRLSRPQLKLGRGFHEPSLRQKGALFGVKLAVSSQPDFGGK
jgi:hypothetical protein